MEKLRRALDRARLERSEQQELLTDGTREQSTDEPSHATGDAAAVSPAGTATAPDAMPDRQPAVAEPRRAAAMPVAEQIATASSRDYSYTTTTTFRPDPAVLERHRILSTGSTLPAAESFRMLRTQIAQRMSEKGWRTLAVCSPSRGDGRTLAAVNLAVTLAADSRYSVLLCDLDLRAPSVAGLFGLEARIGVDDVLAGRATVEEALVHPLGFDRLVLLPARGALPGSSEYLASDVTSRLVAELRARYPDRILIFDLPPVLTADDALAFSPNVECALVVVTEGVTRREHVTHCLEVLRNTPIIGTVLNRSVSRNSAAA